MKSKPLVYIVDDSQIHRTLVFAQLKSKPITCEIFASGGEVLEALDVNNPPAIVVTDYEMPGMNGVELIEKLRVRLNSDLYSILITAYNDIDVLSQAINSDINKFLSKPVDNQRLEKFIDEALEITLLRSTKIRLIQELYRKNNELEYEKSKLESIFDAIEEPVVILNEELRIADVNNQFERLSNYQKQELIGTDINKFIVKQDVKQARVTGLTKDKKLVELNYKVSSFNDEQSNLITYIVTLHDNSQFIQRERMLTWQKEEFEKQVRARTTELKKAKDEAVAANKSKSEFLANMSHELRTPMHAILSYSHLMQKVLAQHEIAKNKLDKYSGNIATSANRLLNLINALLDMSKLESGKMDFAPRFHRLSKTVLNVMTELTPLIEEKALKLEFDFAHDPSIKFDEILISQVITNLLSNAIKFSDVNGKIILTAKLNGDRVGFCVEDYGIGIPPSELDTIFDKFYQSSKTNTGEGGTGLGLSICREILAVHDGIIYAQSDGKTGSAITFELPLKKE